MGHLAKDCRAALPTKSVEDEDEIVWGSLLVDELDDIDAARAVLVHAPEQSLEIPSTPIIALTREQRW